MYLVKIWPLKLYCLKKVNTHSARPKRLSFIRTLCGSNPSTGYITEFFYVLPNSRKYKNERCDDHSLYCCP
jgi:hypothetical protein